jgi:hypothetical protein
MEQAPLGESVLWRVAPTGLNDFAAMIEHEAALDGLHQEIAEAWLIPRADSIHTLSVRRRRNRSDADIVPTASAGSGFGCGAGFAWRGYSGLDEKSPAAVC